MALSNRFWTGFERSFKPLKTCSKVKALVQSYIWISFSDLFEDLLRGLRGPRTGFEGNIAFFGLSWKGHFALWENLSKPLKTGSKSWKFAIRPKAKKAFSFEIDVLNLFWTILVYLTCFLDQFSLESGFVCQVRISVNRENDIWYKRGNSRKFVQNPQNLFSSTFPRFDLNRQSKHSQFSSTSQLSLKTVSVLGAVLPCRMGSNSNFLSNFLSNFSQLSNWFQLSFS